MNYVYRKGLWYLGVYPSVIQTSIYFTVLFIAIALIASLCCGLCWYRGGLSDLEFMVFRFAVVYAGLGVGFPALMLLLKVFVAALKELGDTSVVRSEA